MHMCVGGCLMDLIADGCLYKGFKLKNNRHFSLINVKMSLKLFFIFSFGHLSYYNNSFIWKRLHEKILIRHFKKLKFVKKFGFGQQSEFGFFKVRVRGTPSAHSSNNFIICTFLNAKYEKEKVRTNIFCRFMPLWRSPKHELNLISLLTDLISKL